MTGILKVDDIQDAGANSIVSSNGSGTLTLGSFTAPNITASTAILPDASDGAAIGSASLEWSDIFLADGAVINLGDDQDVTLTHVADTGIQLNSTMKLMFNDASQYIQGASATVLDIAATDEIELTATLVDLNGNLDVSGTYTGAGLMTTGGNIVIPDTGNIGSASDTDAIAIAANGVTTFSQAPVLSGASLTAGTTPLTTLDIDGATDIGAAIVDADLFIVDDGAGGTNRKVTASRLKTYATGSLVKIAGVEVTSATAGVELQSCFNTTYDSYMLVVRRFIPVTNNQDLQMQIMTSTNTVITATNYFYAFRYFEDTGSVGGPVDNDGSFFKLGSSVTSTEQDGGFSGSYLVNVDKTDDSGNSFKISGTGGVRNVNGDLTAYWGAGVYNDSTGDVSPTGLKFTAASGNVLKLQVTVYGIAE